MGKYRIIFTGRKLHAIGITYPITAEVVAEGIPAAVLSLYDTYDCVMAPQVLVYDSETGQYGRDLFDRDGHYICKVKGCYEG